MRLAGNVATKTQTGKEGRVIESITLGPRQDAKIPLGFFEAAMPQPRFQIECEPSTEAIDGIAAALERVDKDDEYWLVYFLQNFTDRTYRIIVREQYT